MKIPFSIGKNSNDENYLVDLAATPLLLVSYSEDFQLDKLLYSIFHLNYLYNENLFLLTNHRRFLTLAIKTMDKSVFLRDEPEMGTIRSRQELINRVLIEMSRRRKILNAQNNPSFSIYYSLNIWKTIKLGYTFFIVDDVVG